MMYLRKRRFVRLHVGLSVFLLIALMWNVSFADVLVLRTGGRIEGTLANREVVQRDPFAFTYVSFLLLPANRAPELLSFDVDEVDYILLDSGDGSRVIDFRAAPGSPGFPTTRSTPPPRSPESAQRNDEEHQRRQMSRGVAMMLFGICVGVLAVANPFESNWYYNGYTKVDLDDSYNVANYTLMVVGGACVIAGISMVNRSLPPRDRSVSVQPLSGGAGLRRSWKF